MLILEREPPPPNRGQYRTVAPCNINFLKVCPGTWLGFIFLTLKNKLNEEGNVRPHNWGKWRENSMKGFDSINGTSYRNSFLPEMQTFPLLLISI